MMMMMMMMIIMKLLFISYFYNNLLNFIDRGLLNIVTEDAQWSYDVKGSYPSTQINTAVIKSKVDSNRPKT
jgi:hypothetical protein